MFHPAWRPAKKDVVLILCWHSERWHFIIYNMKFYIPGEFWSWMSMMTFMQMNRFIYINLNHLFAIATDPIHAPDTNNQRQFRQPMHRHLSDKSLFMNVQSSSSNGLKWWITSQKSSNEALLNGKPWKTNNTKLKVRKKNSMRSHDTRLEVTTAT